jgi:hypothetical protein
MFTHRYIRMGYGNQDFTDKKYSQILLSLRLSNYYLLSFLTMAAKWNGYHNFVIIN